MPGTNLDTGLQELRTQMIQMGLQVEDSLAKTLKAVETGDIMRLTVYELSVFCSFDNPPGPKSHSRATICHRVH